MNGFVILLNVIEKQKGVTIGAMVSINQYLKLEQYTRVGRKSRHCQGYISSGDIL